MSRTNLPGKFTLTRSSNDVFNLRIVDELSGVSVLEAVIDPLVLIYALTGLAGSPMTFTLREQETLERVGLKKKWRSINIPKEEADRHIKPWSDLKMSHPHREALRAEGRAELEKLALAIAREQDGDAFIEGWMLGVDGVGSQQPPHHQNVSLVRWDEATPEEIERAKSDEH